MIADLSNNLPDFQRCETGSGRRPQSGCCRSTSSDIAQHLPAWKRAAIRGLQSRIVVLQKSSQRTCSIECSDLYNKAILAAQCDIRILETV